MEIRAERPEDFREVETLTREAFWNLHVPGCDEHLALHILRETEWFVPELSLVALNGGEIMAHIAFSRCHVQGEGAPFEAVLFGPVSVWPRLQGKGIGSALIRHSIEAARGMGYPAIFIYGDPRYYGRFGFESGRGRGISSADGSFTDALMALPLREGALDGVSGRLVEALEGEYDPQQLAAFDAQFPPLEKREMPSQREFARRVRELRGGD